MMGLLSRASSILNSAGDVNYVDDDSSAPVSIKIEISNDELDLLAEKVSQFHGLYQDIGCILLENTHHGRGKVSFLKKITEMIGTIGIVIPINHDLPLILVPAETDRELIAHRLSKSLNAKSIFSFNTDNPENVMKRIKSLS